jgi:hypothetical protein
VNVRDRSLPADADHETTTASGYVHFVVPNKRGDGFRASVRGHMFELVDPESSLGLVPTPLDLLTAAIAADLAWFRTKPSPRPRPRRLRQRRRAGPAEREPDGAGRRRSDGRRLA